jgi:hypothetical protein
VTLRRGHGLEATDVIIVKILFERKKDETTDGWRQRHGVVVRNVAHSFTHQWLYSPLLGPGPFFSFVISLTQTVGPLGRVISPSQGRYLHTGQHKHRINAHRDIHASSGIRTHDPSVRRQFIP